MCRDICRNKRKKIFFLLLATKNFEYLYKNSAIEVLVKLFSPKGTSFGRKKVCQGLGRQAPDFD